MVLAASCACILSAPNASHAAGAALVNESPIDRMVALNKQALDDILNQHFQAAKYWLNEALVISETAGLESDEITARTYVHLAATELAGSKDRDEAVRCFDLALKINPNIAITRGLELPGLKSVYLQARQQAGLPPNPDPTVPSFDTFAADTAEDAGPGSGPSAFADVESASSSAGREMHTAAPVRPAYAAALVGEPDPPARVPAPLYCPLPFEARPGRDLVVRCLTQKHTYRSSAIFHYRAGGVDPTYIDLPMDRSPKGWLVAVVPGAMIGGRDLGYYVTAQIPGSQPALHLGDAGMPRSLVVRAEPAGETGEDTKDPMAHSQSSGARRGVSSESRRRAVGSVWLSVSGGSGFVYHARETVDSNSKTFGSTEPVEVEEGFSPATLLQLEPEIGYQATRRLSVSVMARYQYAPKDVDESATVEEQEAVLTSAFAVYLHARLSFLTIGRLQAYASGGAGFGRSFLAVVDKDCQGTRCTLRHSDTLHGGDFGLLAGVGAVYHLTPALGVFAEVKEVATLPKFMALTEFSLGVAVAVPLGQSAAGRSATAVDDGSAQ